METEDVPPALPLLLTASVSTRGMRGACFTDNEREAMYAGALAWYVQNLPEGQPITLCDNSGWDLRRLLGALPPGTPGDRVELIQLPPEEFDISRGKGYNELLMMDKAIARSASIQRAGAFFKATGRYPILNLARFLGQARTYLLGRGGQLFCDVKDHKLYDLLRLGWTGHAFECRLYGCRLDFWSRRLAPLYAQCNDYDGHLCELVMFDAVKASSQAGEAVSLRFDREPHFAGLEGSEIDAPIFSKDQDSLRGRVKRLAGNAIRIFTPWFKF